ncbi:MAG: hypothetical protein ACFBSG_18145 [Leptolyngbyaceae cyanobacterium]
MEQHYFSDEEWTLLRQAPTQAAIAVILADKTDPVSFLKETQAAAQILLEEQARVVDEASDLVSAVLEAMGAAETSNQEHPGLPNATPVDLKQLDILIKIRAFENASKGREQAIAHVDKASEILASKVTIVQTQEFNKWLVNIAHRVASAVKEKGFLGIGGEWESDDERSVIKKLEKALEFKD